MSKNSPSDDVAAAESDEDVPTHRAHSLHSIMADVRRRARSTLNNRPVIVSSDSEKSDVASGCQMCRSIDFLDNNMEGGESVVSQASDSSDSSDGLGSLDAKSQSNLRKPAAVPFRWAVTVPMAVAMLASCIAICSVLSWVFGVFGQQSIDTFKSSVGLQGQFIDTMVQKSTHHAFLELLVSMELSVHDTIIAPATRSLGSIWGSMRLLHRITGSTTPDSVVSEALQFACWVSLRDQWNDDRMLKGNLSYTSTVAIAYSDEMLVGATVPLDFKQTGASFLYEAPPTGQGVQTVMNAWQANASTGAPIAKTSTTEFLPTQRPIYKVQDDLAHGRLGDGSKELVHAWTKLTPFTAPITDHPLFGLSLTWPIAYCGNYNCFQGVVAADVSLETVHAACRQEWEELKVLLQSASYNYEITQETSAVFIVNQYSQYYPRQEGHLIGASGDLDSAGPVLDDVALSPHPLVRKAAQALILRYGKWRSPALQTEIANFTFTKTAIVNDKLETCRHWNNLTWTETNCMQVVARSIALDDTLRWMVVVVLPAAAFRSKSHGIAKQMAAHVRSQEDQLRTKFGELFVASVIVSVVMILMNVCVGMTITTMISRPLRILSTQMKRLGTLDVALPGNSQLRYGFRRLAIAEILEVVDGFSRLSRSIQCFSHFVPEVVVRNIVHGPRRARRMYVDQRRVTIMFSDVKDFTAMSEKLSSKDLIFVLFVYLSEMTRIVEAFEGVVSEILGDGLLVFWNTPSDVDNHATKACAAALAQQRALHTLNHNLDHRGLPKLEIRLGLHTGDVLSGNIGSDVKMKFGCIGDPINLASRLEGLAKYYGVSALISGVTQDDVDKGAFEFRKLDLVQVKGKQQPIVVYELLGQRTVSSERRLTFTGNSASERCLAGVGDKFSTPHSLRWPRPLLRATSESVRKARKYEESLEMFQKAQLPQAAALAQSLLQEYPGDVPTTRLLARAMQPPPRPGEAPWTSVLVMSEK